MSGKEVSSCFFLLLLVVSADINFKGEPERFADSLWPRSQRTGYTHGTLSTQSVCFGGNQRGPAVTLQSCFPAEQPLEGLVCFTDQLGSPARASPFWFLGFLHNPRSLFTPGPVLLSGARRDQNSLGGSYGFQVGREHGRLERTQAEVTIVCVSRALVWETALFLLLVINGTLSFLSQDGQRGFFTG